MNIELVTDTLERNKEMTSKVPYLQVFQWDGNSAGME